MKTQNMKHKKQNFYEICRISFYNYNFMRYLGWQNLWIRLAFAWFLLLGISLDFSAKAQTIKPSYELKVGARNSTIRNIGSFKTDSALIFPKREAKDTIHSKTLRKKGAFFYDSVTKIVWFNNGKHFRTLAGTNIYNRDDSIHNQNRTVSMNGHSLIFDNNKDHGMVLFRNSEGDNLLKVEADEKKNKKSGLWLTGTLHKNGSGDYKKGFKMVNNPKDNELEFYTTSQGISKDQLVILPGNNHTIDNKVLSIHQNGTVQIYGTGTKPDLTGKAYNFPTIKFQRVGNKPNYWYIQYNDYNDGLYFGKNEKPFLTTDKFKVDYRNRLAITNDVIIVGPTKYDTYNIYDVNLGINGYFGGYQKVFNVDGVKEKFVNIRNRLIPALFVNGAAQASQFIVGSDSSLKHDIHNIQDALPKLLQLRPVTYYWKDTSEGSGFGKNLQTGFIAQEVQKIFPDLVYNIWAQKPNTLGVNYIGIIPEMVAGMQELYQKWQKQVAENTQLKQNLAEEKQLRQSLEYRAQDLEQRVQNLEKLLQQILSKTLPQSSANAEPKGAILE